MSPRTKKASDDTALEQKVEMLLEELKKSEAAKGALVDMIAKQGLTAPQAGQMMVGIRNVSNTTIGIAKSPVASEPPVQLHAVFGNEHDPSSVAIISWPWWQQLRKGKLVANGLIVRDDSILGSAYTRAPADDERDMPKTHKLNLVLDPHEFITGQSEAELRARIKEMTSEESLRRILVACDHKVRELQARYSEDDEQRAAKAVAELPGSYQIAEAAAMARLDELGHDRSIEATRFSRRVEE